MDRRGYSTGQRHGWLDRWTGMLSRMLDGEAASALARTGHDPDGPVVVLPSWLWTEPRATLGRKARAVDGGLLQFPVRVSWQDGLVVAARPGTHTYRWSATGLGFDLSGTLELHTDGDRVVAFGLRDVTNSGPGAIAEAEAEALSPLQLDCEPRLMPGDQLGSLVADGFAATWAAILELEGRVRDAVRRANISLSIDVSGDLHCAPLLDDNGVQQLVDVLLFGEGDAAASDSPSVVRRIIAKCLDPLSFARVEPSRFVQSEINRDAVWAVRHKLGDPHSGSKIRRVARDLDTDDPELVLEEYRNRFPAEKMGLRRVSHALSVAPDAMARTVSWDTVRAGLD